MYNVFLILSQQNTVCGTALKYIFSFSSSGTTITQRLGTGCQGFSPQTSTSIHECPRKFLLQSLTMLDVRAHCSASFFSHSRKDIVNRLHQVQSCFSHSLLRRRPRQRFCLILHPHSPSSIPSMSVAYPHHFPTSTSTRVYAVDPIHALSHTR